MDKVTGFSYHGFFRIDKENERIRFVLFKDVTEVKDLPTNYHMYVNGDLFVSADGNYAEASGELYEVWRKTGDSKVSDIKREIVWHDELIYKRKSWFNSERVAYYANGTKLVERVTSPQTKILRYFNHTVSIHGVGITEIV